MDNIEEKLKRLGYSDLWIKSGFLKEEELTEQISMYESGEDRNTEHFRYKAFKNLLRNAPGFTDADVENFFRLIEIDGDPEMAMSVVLDLLSIKHLSDSQYVLSCNLALNLFGDKIKSYVDKKTEYRSNSH